MSTSTEELLTARQAARVLGVVPRTLKAWRKDGRELPFVRLSSRAIRYRRSDLEDFITRKTIGRSNGDE